MMSFTFRARCISTLLAGLFTLVSSEAQETAGSIKLPQELEAIVKSTRVHDIASVFPKGTRHLTVYLPENYDRDVDTRYPVMYILDGQVNALYMASITRIFADRDRAPGVIVVSLPSQIVRDRDYTPPNDVDSGLKPNGANRFLDYLEKELIPFVDETYRTEPFRILSGESRGGLLVLHSLIERPSLFQARFALSPALYHHDAQIIQRLQSFLEGAPGLQSFLYMNTGNEGGIFKTAFDAAWDLFKENPPSDLTWKVEALPDQHHGLTGISGQYTAFRILFAEWRIPIDAIDAHGASAVLDHFEMLSEQYGYDVKPSETALIAYGGRFMRSEKFGDALGLFRLATSHYPRSANAFDNLGQALKAAGQDEEAIAMTRKAIEIASRAGDSRLPRFRNHLRQLERGQ